MLSTGFNWKSHRPTAQHRDNMATYNKTLFHAEASPHEYEQVLQFLKRLDLDPQRLLPTSPGVPTRNNIFLSLDGSVIFKCYDLSNHRIANRFRSRWKIGDSKFGQRYGWAEWNHASRALASGINTPRPLAYFEAGHLFGCSMQIVAFERVLHHKTLFDLFLEESASTELLQTTLPALQSLASARIFHIDLNCRNILISSDHRSAKIIDWEYACFDLASTNLLLAFYLGYLFLMD